MNRWWLSSVLLADLTCLTGCQARPPWFGLLQFPPLTWDPTIVLSTTRLLGLLVCWSSPRVLLVGQWIPVSGCIVGIPIAWNMAGGPPVNRYQLFGRQLNLPVALDLVAWPSSWSFVTLPCYLGLSPTYPPFAGFAGSSNELIDAGPVLRCPATTQRDELVPLSLLNIQWVDAEKFLIL